MVERHDVDAGAGPDWWLSGSPGSQCPGEEGSVRSLTGCCPDAKKPAIFSPDGMAQLATEYQVRAKLRRHMADPRISVCGCRVYGDPEVITREYADGSRRAQWKGVILCNRAGCPVCGAIRARRFGERVQRTLGSGGTWQHVIMTVPHSPGEAWTVVYDRLLSGVKDLSHGQAGRLMKGVIQASVRATETTWSMRSGWHVHFHVLWRLTRPLLAAEREVLTTQWCERTGANLAYGIKFGAIFNCNVEGEREAASKYVSKLANELSGAFKRVHPEHWSLGEIYAQAAEDDELYIDLVLEYQEATKGRRIYQLDRRAKQLHDSAPELPETQVTAEWRVTIHREEFAGLSRAERYARDYLAIFLPLEVAATARGDPAEDILEAIDSLLRAHDATPQKGR